MTPVADDGAPDDRLARAAGELEAAAQELDDAVERAAQAERTLAASEFLADALLSLVEKPLIVLDTDLRIIGWSAGAETCWSRSASDAVGRRWSRLGRSVDPSATAAQLDKLIEAGAPASVPFGDGLRIRLVVEEGVVHYLLISQADS